MKCKLKEGAGHLLNARTYVAELTSMSWDENGELDAKENRPLVQKLWDSHSLITSSHAADLSRNTARGQPPSRKAMRHSKTIR